jgi:5-methylthioadenosine/S-adenosylhomocysteine deaminase
MEKNQILIGHGTVVTLDEERRIIKDGAVLVEGSEISYVGKTSGLAKTAQGGRVINAEGKLVLPGLVNTHTHLEYSGIDRGIADDIPLSVFLSERLRPI